MTAVILGALACTVTLFAALFVPIPVMMLILSSVTLDFFLLATDLRRAAETPPQSTRG